MAEAESLRQAAQARAPFSAWFGTVLLFMLFGVMVLAVVGPSVRTDNYEQARAQKRVDFLKTLREEDAKALTTYAIIDKASGSAHIPIARAMQLTVTELARQKPAPAYPVVAAMPAPTPPAQASPAPSLDHSAAPAPSVSTSAVPSTTPASATSSSTGPAPAAKPKEVEGPQSEIRLQPAAAANPPAAKPATQPGRGASPQLSPASAGSQPAVRASGTPNPSPPGSPLPVAGKTPPPAP